MNELLSSYLPIVIFLGIAMVIGVAFWLRRSSSHIDSPTPKSFLLTSAASMPSMTPA